MHSINETNRSWLTGLIALIILIPLSQAAVIWGQDIPRFDKDRDLYICHALASILTILIGILNQKRLSSNQSSFVLGYYLLTTALTFVLPAVAHARLEGTYLWLVHALFLPPVVMVARKLVQLIQSKKLRIAMAIFTSLWPLLGLELLNKPESLISIAMQRYLSRFQSGMEIHFYAPFGNPQLSLYERYILANFRNYFEGIDRVSSLTVRLHEADKDHPEVMIQGFQPRFGLDFPHTAAVMVKSNDANKEPWRYSLESEDFSNISNILSFGLDGFSDRPKPFIGIYSDLDPLGSSGLRPWRLFESLSSKYNFTKVASLKDLPSTSLDGLIMIMAKSFSEDSLARVLELQRKALPIILAIDPFCMECSAGASSKTPDREHLAEFDVAMAMISGGQYSYSANLLVGDPLLAAKVQSVGFLEANPFILRLQGSYLFLPFVNSLSDQQVTFFKGGGLVRNRSVINSRFIPILETSVQAGTVEALHSEYRSLRSLARELTPQTNFHLGILAVEPAPTVVLTDIDMLTDRFVADFTDSFGRDFWLATNANLMLFDEIIKRILIKPDLYSLYQSQSRQENPAISNAKSQLEQIRSLQVELSGIVSKIRQQNLKKESSSSFLLSSLIMESEMISQRKSDLIAQLNGTIEQYKVVAWYPLILAISLIVGHLHCWYGRKYRPTW